MIVLAAGGGTRMKSKTMKVLHPIAGRSMIGHVLGAVVGLEPHRVVAVVGNQREQVGPHIQELLPDAVLAVQETQDGTGHAVRVAWEALDPADRVGTVLVAYGDTPLLEGESLRAFAEDHVSAGRGVSILSGDRGEPVRLRPGAARRRPAPSPGSSSRRTPRPSEAAVTEINSGILAFDADFLDARPAAADQRQRQRRVLPHRHRRARPRGRPRGGRLRDRRRPADRGRQRPGPARRRLAQEQNRRILTGWMRDGVTIIDPATTWIDVDVRLAPDVTILPGVQLLGATVVEEDAVIGPDTHPQGRRGRRRRTRRTHARRARRDRRRRQRRAVLLPAARHRARRGRQDRRLRRDQERPDRRAAPRCRTCPTSATPRSARAPTSAPARSSPTTTGSRSTARSSAGTPGRPATTPSSPPCTSATVPAPAPAP